jgi:hypothetical protein
MMTEKKYPPGGYAQRSKPGDEGLGANSDIGAKLRALYGAVEDEAIPDRLLDLLEKLDAVESQQVQVRSKG